MIGVTNIFTSNEDLIGSGFTYIAHVPAFVPKFAGISEVLGGIGLILPAATRIQPQLTVWAATGLMLVVVIAIIMYSWLGEWANIPSPIVTGGLLAFVIWGRNSKLPISSR
ncbi:MAG TPA: DoxX family membrane protein [Candidatus Thalassarchaeaceae archaeon]|nr:DoxX family membrane protein [Candidatus Thalassarchaeaceae archaeon]